MWNTTVFLSQKQTIKSSFANNLELKFGQSLCIFGPLWWKSSLLLLNTVKPPLVDSLNKGHFLLREQHDMHGLNFK